RAALPDLQLTVDANSAYTLADTAALQALDAYRLKPGWDEVPVAAVRAALPDLQLTVDANSAYTLADTAALQALDAYRL
ncbi:o-succinylbenzoate synthase, partial [Methylobacterium radiotolerans]